MRPVEITSYLEMLSREQFAPARLTDDLVVRRVTAPTVDFVKFLWSGVGTPWNWESRLKWSDQDWEELVTQPKVEIWTGYTDGTPVGYFELSKDDHGDVELLFFGLLPQFIGKGYGGHLLNEAVSRAWDMGAKRVWVHTCNFDGPHALANYEARGFRKYDEKRQAPAPVNGVRPATKDDVSAIVELVRELAEYEKLVTLFELTEESLHKTLFGPSPAVFAHVIEHEQDDNKMVAGYALWFLTFSTFLGKHGIYIEDVYVRPELRGNGYGTALLRELARTCVERDYGRLEWSVLDWNEPSIGFYKSLGAQSLDDWTMFRVTDKALEDLGG